MPILSDAFMDELERRAAVTVGLPLFFIDMTGTVRRGRDPLALLPGAGNSLRNALQRAVGNGAAHCHEPIHGIQAWMIPLEHNRMLLGGVGGVGVRVSVLPPGQGAAAEALAAAGMDRESAFCVAAGLPGLAEDEAPKLAQELYALAYAVSGWVPHLLRGNRRRIEQQVQWNASLEERRHAGEDMVYAFERERNLLACIRAGDRHEARRMLNEMLSGVFLSNAELVVIRARAIELMSSLVRAAVEENPLLEPLLRQHREWTVRLVETDHYEGLSAVLTGALDDFVDGVYLHGVNRTNVHVQRATEFIARHYMEPIGLADAAAAAGISASRLAHVMRHCTGRTTVALIREVRIRRAQELLERSTLSCAEVGYAVGFSDQSYFTRQFRLVTGRTPAGYRRDRG